MVESKEYQVPDFSGDEENLTCEDSGLYESDDDARVLVINLEDDDGKRLPNADYKLEFADGSTRSGTTDEDGTLTEHDVPPGQFHLTITSEDKEEPEQDEEG